MLVFTRQHIGVDRVKTDDLLLELLDLAFQASDFRFRYRVAMVIALVNWVQIARVIYTETTALASREYIEATIHREGVKMAAKAIASSSAGKAIMRSVKRMMAAPTQP